jgi:hypothetical protein
VDHSGHFPWEWDLGDVDDFFAHARSISNLSFSTVRSYRTHLKLFCDYLTDPAYEWDRVCVKAFGRSPGARHKRDRIADRHPLMTQIDNSRVQLHCVNRISWLEPWADGVPG